MSNRENRKQVATELDDDLYDRLAAYCRENDRSMASQLRRLIRDAVGNGAKPAPAAPHSERDGEGQTQGA